ncbi:type VI secretion system ATPase TssH [Vibrio parahaemolyticus]|uniref:type VI secretion system ATPase TssH n=1 Tax=Vibrio harveyi group TaxID=717610 RepID=UPI000C86BB4C|nr:type VI secretion system ATPase TssH [Vibrio parahaemolyticus]QLK44815.1 type VI secretion system ATPase TssH [Vibrio owensii]AYO02910.1 type VI secretion system ATPase TssH [Vibrio parahaemolyticus]EHK0753050.1 type VI secretion system ATPase TssH [Vibrio parahaemolyticus]EHR5320107.1 type VI secretion system ATPase TssH [Vibrio parahaemolyticus]EJB8454264.1 type VI secretion system ATPase TssH [Vibrio parahaemolyticus]
MIRIELPILISKLNEQSKLALEQAAALCIERQHNEITFEHYLDVLLDNPLSDIRCLLKQENLSTEKVKATLLQTPVSEPSSDTYPSFSPLLVELLQEAWLLSSTELEQPQLRSGAILLAALLRSSRYLSHELERLFHGINREGLKRQFASHFALSGETPTEKGPGPLPITDSASQDVLTKYCTNMTEQARNHELDPVLCRDDEMDLMIDILCRRRKNNPIVVGDAGVGKSAVVEGLAQRIIAKQVPERLQDVTLLALDLGRLQAGASVKGEFEKRLKGVIDAIKHSATPIILFIDEAHTLIGAGNQEGAGDAANLLKPALARGELSTIAATTWKEYKKYIEKDAALTRRFQLVKLDEPTVLQASGILRGLVSVYEEAHQVFITDDALQAACELSGRYLSGRQLPDKAIDVLDTACARIAINLTAPPKRIAQLDGQIMLRSREIQLLERAQWVGLNHDKDKLALQHKLNAHDEEEKAQLLATWQEQKTLVSLMITTRKQLSQEELSEGVERQCREELAMLHTQWEAIPSEERLMHPYVDEKQIAEVIADWTGVPASQMKADELHKMTHLAELLQRDIKGQTPAIEQIHRHLLTARADLRRTGRPKGAFLLVGPSGVGKTETVVQLTEQLYGGKQFLTTINMSEYQEKHTVSRLIGSPPGYVGFGEGGVLTEAIRKMPYSVVLLDEVEKAHPDVFNLFYQAFDKGELADGEGRLIDCQNVVFFLTSNLGYQTIVDHADFSALPQLNDALYPELASFFKPALLARMEVIPYLPLSQDILQEIVKHKLGRLETLFETRYGAKVVITENLIEEILRRATRSENGARMLEAIIEGELLPPVSLSLLSKLAEQAPIRSVRLDANEGEFIGEVE